jgi:hypothetical protein
MTNEDRIEIRTLIETAVEATEGRLNVALQTTKEQLVETIRDMQTEMLRGLEAFARQN